MEQLGNAWVQVALDITSGISDQDRFDRLLSTIRHTLKCDASALLLFRNQQFVPLAINGLSEDVLGRRFDIEKHPRLEAIARAGDIVRFPPDSDLPDPYDGLIPNHEEELKVHSCIGLPLMLDDRLIGAVTIDAFDPAQFDYFNNDDLRIVSALAASSLNTALLMEQLERTAGVGAASPKRSRKLNYPEEIIGQSSPMLELKSQIDAVADTDLSVLIMGETGVGKELVANALHSQSRRSDNALVYLNCAALPESVAESELFGHVKGAFTGAISNRKGKFELADNGTLFLDEVGELSLSLQAKLLRALQYGDIQRVGDDRNIKVNVRIIAATNRVMHEEVKQGNFRADLYHRLGVFPVFVPPLRERDKDVVLLAGFFAERCAHKLGVANISLDAATLTVIQNYSWPGNVRELEHAINRASVIAKSNTQSEQIILLPHHFNFSIEMTNQHVIDSLPVDGGWVTNTTEYLHLGLKEAIDLFQTQLVQSAYLENDKKLSATAEQLKVNPGNLHRLMKRLNLK
ncbi:transcriptional regulator [Shewanella mangrovi]|uniref:Transcriptional regulator n=3 Tax=Shewanella TaxID=22 RepID=A0A094LMZ8_9GAMM|nr:MULTISPECIES: nitric oxide reductase transcriptional regulator NorR [Shewanella]KFZ36503.1 transcriptional regulator [Shewanella mangrovi]QSX33784.1 nitric oxide reductase transcriptional regulator NorR [Shewanella avicenniae]QUN05106.1 nitric oxide reductase transcriptional regulator NorR [Shewanella yunxiaonensis]